MFCQKCGTQLKDNVNFCSKCGAPVKANVTGNESEKSFPSQQAPHYDSYSTTGTQKKNPKSSIARTILGFMLKILLLFALIVGVLLALDYFDVIDASMVNAFMEGAGFKDTDVTAAPTTAPTTEPTAVPTTEPLATEYEEIERPNADEYYASIATIVREISVPESADVQTEAEAQVFIIDRGFTDFPVSYEYSMDGHYSGTEEVDAESSDKHPIYQSYYISAENELWSIFVINGAIMAKPVSYSMQAGNAVEVLISETETLISYDSETNKFYEIKPYESETKVIVVDKIDAEALDALTVEAIGELCTD